ncbi:hypothetical protein [Flavobacterium facile]|uniref:hypothetical protein n=1 Tax=Flavobacterium facile TaxID=2893174 RepID=UPI002E791C43|nr:hypothetical protein [Flavobacterium sp. T-12]
MKKIFNSFIVLLTFFIVSCSTNETSLNDSQNIPEEAVAMSTSIDGLFYDTPPQIGGNLAENSGGSSFGGSAYFLLNGYRNLNNGFTTNRIGNKIYNIYLAIPKNNLSVGIHNFSSTFNSGDFYADFDVSGVLPTENVNTISGFIKITSFDTTTRLLKGNFNFTTNNGVDLTTITHELVGTFAYVLP